MMGAITFAAAGALGLAVYKLPLCYGWSFAELHKSSFGANVPTDPTVWAKLVGTAALARMLLDSAPGAYATSFYRSRETQAAVYKSLGKPAPSYNPHETGGCVDIGGPRGVLDLVAANARAQGAWRQVLWQVEGHFDHVHCGR